MSYENYRITLLGCEGATSITFQLDPHEIPLLQEIADKINAASEDQCEPTMSIEEIK